MSSFNIVTARNYLHDFQIRKLFIELMGWDRPGGALDIVYEGNAYRLEAVAQKRGLSVYIVPPLVDGKMPDYAGRRKIEALVRRSVHEHLLIFTNADKSEQKWQWVRREAGRPVTAVEFDYRRGQSGEALLQRLQQAVFRLDEEDTLMISEVTSRVRATFDVERVTRRFYDYFKDERNTFKKFLEGIPDENLQRWYVSVMLNRLMFIYFIQKKGFLGGDQDYLRHKLEQQGGKDRFYREFLCPLFFEGFARKANERSEAARQMLGNVPYLNGGIFQQHQIEMLHGKTIRIADEAFRRLFEFFDRYRWHLDERPLRADDEINPDVLGYIFEKYINQKQMGAYYTKEDITGYISQNTIIPAIFERAKRMHGEVFEGESSIWKLLQADPDRYIYPAVQHGVNRPLPPEIEAGVKEVAKRGEWNKTAPEEYALPTEIWREVAARRQRYAEVRGKLESGEIREINDLITYNLDIRQFAQDVVESLPTAEALRAFTRAITTLRILDPTVGSGAFLFAALNVLEPLLEACFERMQAFVDELDNSQEKHSPEKYADFRELLRQISQHPNREYYILKTIMVYNLYGVDIMDEAVEICKLRLFLKLAAQVEEGGQVEPLPDIDFNIRAGNTLVGYTSVEEVRQAFQTGEDNGVKMTKLFMLEEEQSTVQRIERQAGDMARLFQRMQQQQTKLGGEVRAEDKQQLRERLKTLEDELNQALARQYGIDLKNQDLYRKWETTHKPFHWLVEFYDIMKNGGFDVIIGNPPYVEYSKVRSIYQIKGYITENTGNLYIYVLERTLELISSDSRIGLIVPISLISVPVNKVARSYFLNNGTNWFSNYAIRPAKLFEGVEQRLTICILHRARNTKRSIYSTKYNQWFKDERVYLFEKITYDNITHMATEDVFPKSGNITSTSILKKISNINSDTIALHLVNESNNKLFFHRTPGYWIRMMDFLPYYKAPTGDRSIYHTRELSISDNSFSKFIGAVVNSSLYFFYFFALGNCRNLTLDDVKTFPLGKPTKDIVKSLCILFDKLMDDFNRNSFINHRGPTEFQEFDWELSKPIVDEIDRCLAQHYNLTEEELDFIINYDIKYRMGGGEEEDDSE